MSDTQDQDRAESATGALHAIDRDDYYGGGEGAHFSAVFGDEVYDALRHATRKMNKVEIAVSDAGMHVTAMDRPNISGVNIEIEAEEFGTLDVEEPGYVNIRQSLFEAGVNIWEATHVHDGCYEISTTDDELVDMTAVAEPIGATFPTQSRRNGPPIPESSEYLEHADTFARLKSRAELEQGWVDFDGSGRHDDMAELTGEEGCLTFSDGVGGRRVGLDRMGGVSTAYYEAQEVFNVVSNSAHKSLPKLAWGEETPLVVRSDSGGITVEFMVAPRLSVDIDTPLCKGADSPEVRPR